MNFLDRTRLSRQIVGSTWNLRTVVASIFCIAVVGFEDVKCFADVVVSFGNFTQTNIVPYTSARVTIDVFGAAASGSQNVNAFGLTLTLTGGTSVKTNLVATPVANALGSDVTPPTTFNRLTGSPGVTSGTVSPTFTFARGQPAIGQTTESFGNVSVSSVNLIGTISFDVTQNGVYSLSASPSAIPGNPSLLGFFTQNVPGSSIAVASNLGTTATTILGITAVPEPSSLLLLAIASCSGLGVRRFWKSRSKSSDAKS